MVTGRLPGTVIGQVFRTGTSTPRDFPRYAGIIAKGLDIKLVRDAAIVRCSVEGETLPFSGVTYTAPLSNPAIPDQTRARLYTSDGRTVSQGRWRFQESVSGSNVWDQVVIDSTIFSAGTTYQFDYIANDPQLTDEVPVDDLREVLAVGDNQGQVLYREGIDYRFLTSATGPSAGPNNDFPTQRTINPAAGNPATASSVNTGTGVVTINSGSTYTHDYNRAYVVTCTAAAGVTPTRTATFRVDCFPYSSGFDANIGLSSLQENSVTISIAEATPSTLTNRAVELGISLDFAFGGTNFVALDQFSYQGLGPGIMELADAMVNTNQFAETSAVAIVTATGEGTIDVNPQSVYTGATNQKYELEVTDALGTGNSREATFRWRTNPKVLKLTGTVTATNGSTALVGAGTSFVSELAANDYLFIGTDPIPVQVASVTNAGAAVLSATYPFTTQAGVPVIRVRESTGSVTVLVTDPNRVSIDQGLFLDFDFGSLSGDNFDVGDTFSFTALVARNQYNGKENRNYDFTVTSTSASHQLTMTYAGSTPSAGFGTHTFSEGNPLVLSNNTVIHARNLALSAANSRFVAGPPPPDTFDLSLTFDGLIDWTLETERTETISTSDFLRDLTGSVTGTVGAYYVLLRKVPESVLYVRGPASSFTNFAFNQVAGTTIVWFSSNPGVNLTIKYRFAGIEPQPGATYYMTGYIKRPDSDYEAGQVFFTRDQAREFLAPMTASNDAAIANEIAWDQDAANLPGVVVFLVKDSDGDGVFTTADYDQAIEVSEAYAGTMDLVVVNQFSAREEFQDSVVNMNDPTVARRRIGYFGFPTNFPIGDEFTPDSRVYVARRELQVFEETIARGTLGAIGNSYAKKTILVDSLGDGNIDTIPTQVTLDGSFLAVGLAARVSSFNEPWQTVYNLPMSGFDEIESLDEREMIRLQDAGIICLRVEGDSAFYVGTMTTDNTEPSTQQLSGTVQRQYVTARLQSVCNERVLGFVADSAEEAAQKLKGEVVAELGSMVSEGKIGRYQNPTTGAARALDPATDVVAFRDRRDPTRAYFRFSFWARYPLLYLDGTFAVDAPTP